MRYAHNANARRSGNFIGGDPHDGPMPLDYFVWAIKGTVGGNGAQLHPGYRLRRGDGGRSAERQFLRSPAVGLKAVGVEPDAGGRRDPVAHALRPLRQLRPVPARPVPPPGQGDGLLHRPLHVPHGPALPVRGRGRGGDRPQAVRRPRRVPRRGRRARAGAVACTTSADTARACRWCGCSRAAAGWCWPPTPAISMRTWRKAAPSRSCTATRTRWRATRRCAAWPARRTRSFPATTRWCWQRYPAAAPGLEGIVHRLDADPVA